MRPASDQPCVGNPSSRSHRIRNLPKSPGRPSLNAHKGYLLQNSSAFSNHRPPAEWTSEHLGMAHMPKAKGPQAPMGWVTRGYG